MPVPRINPALMSAQTRANLEKVQSQLGGWVTYNPPSQKHVKPRQKKKTLTPDMAENLVKSVKVSDDGNQITILLALDPSSVPTAQQKGAFVGKDHKVHFFTKGKVAKAGKALAKALEPYAKFTASWGKFLSN